jgi:DNA polymerase-3 subunit epsilon
MALVVFDTETTGFTKNHLVELGAVIVDHQGEVFTYHSYCKPMTPIEPGATAVHGITNEQVSACRPDMDVVDEFLTDIQGVLQPNEPLIWSGHNCPYDFKVLGNYWNVPQNKLVLDSLKLSRVHCAIAPNHKLETMHKYLECEGVYQAHSAVDDCYMSLDITNFFARQLGLTYLQLAERHSKPILLQTMPFGKHQGTPISSVPVSYITFMLGLPDLSEDVKFTFEHELKRRTSHG